MQKSLILSEAEKEGRKDVVQQNREKRAQSAKKVKSILVRMIYFAEEISNGCSSTECVSMRSYRDNTVTSKKISNRADIEL
jgi:hypothetical protein